jgi:hypothetical protein
MDPHEDNLIGHVIRIEHSSLVLGAFLLECPVEFFISHVPGSVKLKQNCRFVFVEQLVKYLLFLFEPHYIISCKLFVLRVPCSKHVAEL